MNQENEGNVGKPDVPKTKKEGKPKKELTPQQIQKRKKMLIYPLFFLIFIGAMWLIFAPSGTKDKEKKEGFNPELPIPKDENIVGDKRKAYERQAMQDKQNEKMRSLQDFAFMLGEEEKQKEIEVKADAAYDARDAERMPSGNAGIQSSAHAYRDVNRQLNDWYEKPSAKAGNTANPEMESRIEELEKQLAEKSETDKQLELIEKSYALAAKYMPNALEQTQTQTVSVTDTREKVVPRPVSHVHQNVVSTLAAPMENEAFLKQYAKPRNMGFITATENETVTDKNSIRASVYQTVTLSNGKELQLRLLEPMQVGNIIVPANTLLTGSAKLSGERLHITITSIQYADSVIPVEIEVYDMDGNQGIFVPNADEITATKELAANMGNSSGSSITLGGNAGSQLAADLGRNAIQGISQYFGKKMREVKVTLKTGYKVLLLPKS